MTSRLLLPHGNVELPAFLPDATHGVVRSVDADDLRGCGVQALQTNVFHLMLRPGSTTVRALGGVHGMLGWNGPVVTDSGGFQAYSLMRENARYGSIGDRGLVVHPEGSSRKLLLTPEKCIQLQTSYGADVVICLDDCTHPDDPASRQEQSVQRTLAWARRCRIEFDRALDHTRDERKPLLLAVIQGGSSMALRRRCTLELLEIGFDGYGFGGWPLDASGGLLEEVLSGTRELVPPSIPLHALGIGHPRHVAACVRLGYSLLDSVLPTRDARQGRLYSWVSPPAGPLRGDWFAYRYVQDAVHIKSRKPVSEGCGCHCCRTHSLGYLHHLHGIGDALYQRLATIHNLHFMMELMALLRAELARTGELAGS
ncbi:MAG: queuine tRNA-ribosyltransferase family protein [Candidatus Eisenbacteria bacterium]|jgi:queuine tRNA-ribosyltransferase|nr:queuine tRNA-ribosyltransferase family protein [Candidatus Eisenbacteria bacterium]